MWIAIVIITAFGNNDPANLFPSHFSPSNYASRDECESDIYEYYKATEKLGVYGKDSLSININHLGEQFYRNDELRVQIHCIEVK